MSVPGSSDTPGKVPRVPRNAADRVAESFADWPPPGSLDEQDTGQLTGTDAGDTASDESVSGLAGQIRAALRPWRKYCSDSGALTSLDEARAAFEALDRLLDVVNAATALLEVIDGGPARYDASEHSAACNDLASALAAAARGDGQEQDLGGNASVPRGADADSETGGA